MTLLRIDDGRSQGGRFVRMWCPGCNDIHMIAIDVPEVWTWNGDETSPTFQPSIMVRYDFTDGRPASVCHSYVTNGQWNFLADSTHSLAGSVVPMVEIPEGMA